MGQARKNRDAGLESAEAKGPAMISLTTKPRPPTGCGKSRAVESEEDQKQVFLPSHRPWKFRKTRGIPTFPTAPTAAGVSQTTSGNLIVVDRKECLTPDRGLG